jgi:hypothetical protein
LTSENRCGELRFLNDISTFERRIVMILYIVLVFFISIHLTGQAQDTLRSNQVNLSVGLNIDVFNTALKYQHRQMQFGVSYGTRLYPGRFERATVWSIFANKHLFGQSKLSERKPWFVRSGLSWRKDYAYQHLFTSVYFGRDINLHRRVGIAISCGPDIRTWFRDEKGYPRPNFLQPGIDLNLFYRII